MLDQDFKNSDLQATARDKWSLILQTDKVTVKQQAKAVIVETRPLPAVNSLP